MRRGSAKIRPCVPASALRLDEEKSQLETILATSCNPAMAETARIKLRVVNYVRANTSDSRDAKHVKDEPAGTQVSLELPRSVACAPTAHLIDLSRQQPCLDRIHNALLSPIPNDRAPAPTGLPAAAIFHASSAEPNSDPKWYTWHVRIGSLYALLIGVMILLLCSAGNTLSYEFVALGLFLVGASFAVWGTLFVERRRSKTLHVYWEGVKVSRRLYRWHDVEEIALTLVENGCDCTIVIRHGPVFQHTLTYFVPSFPKWLERLRQVCSTPADTNVDGPARPPVQSS